MNKVKKITAAVSALICAGTMAAAQVSADEAVMRYGDVTGNGVVDITDLSYMSLYLIGDFKPNETQIKIMDVDASGECNMADLATMRQFLSHMLTGDTLIGTPYTGDAPAVTEAPVTTPVSEATTVTEAPAVTTVAVTEATTVTTEETTTVTTTVTTEATTVTTTEETTVETTPEPPKEQVYYACDGEIYLGVTETTNGGFLGTSYVNYDNVLGSSLTLTVNAPEDGNYLMTVRFANGTAIARPLSLFVNNSDSYYYMNFEGTGAWTDWSENQIVVALKKGENKIKAVATTDNGGPNVDLVKLIKTDSPAAELTEKTVNPYEAPSSPGSKQVERLDRAVTAVKTANGTLVSWRSLGTDSASTVFKLYRDDALVYTSDPGMSTCFLDKAGSPASSYKVETYDNGAMTESENKSFTIEGEYLEVKLNKPYPMTMPDGSKCEYSANDCSTADVNGDGKLEIIVKWDPSNAKDNSQSGYTGNVYLDCYTLDGKQLWRIDLGKNIRAGAHYTQFMVYDLDGDGKAEMVCKTADGTVDGQGKVIGDGSKDYRNSGGYILSGPEYLTIFNGQTGAAMDTINYNPARGNTLKQTWGDDYGNRVDRFLATVAYLDGKHPSVVMCRGYYTRATLAAYDWNGSKLTQRWFFDSYDGGKDKQGKPNSNYSGQGNHNLVAADVDGDGCQEIIYGSCTIDHDGKGLYSMQLGHGDAIHVSDFVPSRPGLEVWICHEHEPYGCTLSDATTGQLLFRYTADKDTGRCCAANIIPGNSEAEFWGSRSGGIRDSAGNITNANLNPAVNFVINWDGDLESELLDGSVITDYSGGTMNTVFAPSGVATCNSTKNTPNLTADLFGDWREELVLHSEDSSALRIYATTYDTEYRLFTLMHDIQYRTSVSAENTAYNQPPHTSFFLDSSYKLPSYPDVYYPN